MTADITESKNAKVALNYLFICNKLYGIMDFINLIQDIICI